MYSVKEAGAVGDGMTDDAYCIAMALRDNRYVYFPPGDYRITYPMALMPHTRIMGAGRDITRIFNDGNQTHAFFIGTDTPGVEISHLTIEGNYASGATGNNTVHDAINFFGATDMCSGYSVHDCRIKNMSGRGIVFVRHCSDVFVQNNIVENCSIGIFLFGGTQHGFVGNNALRNCRIGGIYLDDATNNAQAGVDAFRPHYNSIHGNQIVNSGYDPVQTGFAIGVSASYGVTITRNIIDRIGEPGVMAATGIMVNSGQDDLFAMANIAVGNNVVSECSGAGIFLEAVNNFTVTGNILVDNNKWTEDNGSASEIMIRSHTKTKTASVGGLVTGNLIRKTGNVISRSGMGVNLSDALVQHVMVRDNGGLA